MAGASHVFLGLFHASELEPGSTAGFGRRRSVADLVGGRHVDERFQLVVQVVLGLFAADDPPHDGREAMQERHAPSSTLATANDDPVPALAMLLELPAAGGREAVVLGAAIVLGGAPFRFQLAVLLQTVERREQRSRVDAGTDRG